MRSKRTGLWAAAALVNLLVALPGAILLLPHWPYLGAPVALLAGAALAALTAHGLARRVHPIALPTVPALASLLTGTALAWALVAYLPDTAWGRATRIGLALTFPVATALALRVRPRTLFQVVGWLHPRNDAGP